MVSLDLSMAETLDWGKIDEKRVLLLIAPRVPPTDDALTSLVRFVEAGGRLIVVDDFLQGPAWMRPFGILRGDDNGTTAEYYEQLQQFPLVHVDPTEDAKETARRWMAPGAKVTPADFLGHNIKGPIVLNHPSALRVVDGLPEGRAAVLWGRYLQTDLGWLAEADRGNGRVLAVADASVFINAMVSRFHENKQFAANVLRYYCVLDRPCHVLALVNLTKMSGVLKPKSRPLAAVFALALSSCSLFCNGCHTFCANRWLPVRWSLSCSRCSACLCWRWRGRGCLCCRRGRRLRARIAFFLKPLARGWPIAKRTSAARCGSYRSIFSKHCWR